MNDTVTDDLLQSGTDTVNILIGFIWLAVATVTVTSLPVLYKKVRCKFPVTVNCWFCNKDTKVPYADANCWDCPYCEQYNGFNKDGGYNKIIKEQHTLQLNNHIYNSVVNQPFGNEAGKDKTPTNGLCKLCNINQQLKITQLANFVPMNENNYDEEVEIYRQQLERSYRLCFQCEKSLKETLHSQQYNFLKDRLNIQKEKSQFFKFNGISSHYDSQIILVTLKKLLCSGLKIFSGIISFTMFLSFIFHLETEQEFFKATLPDLTFLDFHLVLQEFSRYLTYSYDMKKEFVSIGLLCYALSSFFRQVRYDHPGLLLFWAILYALCWSDLTGLQVLVSAACAFLCVIEVHQMPSYSLKKLERIASENGVAGQTENETLSESRTMEPPTGNQQASEGNQDGTMRSSKEAEEMTTLSENKVEDLVDKIGICELPPNIPGKSSPGNKTNEPHVTPQIRSRKIFNKNFLATLDSERIEKELSPPPEIFNNLNNLHISNNCITSSKPSNFLFESHNFEGRCKRNASVIKSPKFVKPTNSSWSNGELNLNDTFSRSSTPSSGYSSQKPDKAETRANNYQFPKVLSPVPLGQSTPPDNFDYWDRNNSYFNSNNFHYFSPGYVPFQQFPSPMGHTAVYTYPRASPNYPFSYTPSPSSPSFSYSHSPRSPRFSDVSDTENLFQNASKSYQADQKWSGIKMIFYNISVFLNIISACALAYFTWSGFISLTGK